MRPWYGAQSAVPLPTGSQVRGASWRRTGADSASGSSSVSSPSSLCAAASRSARAAAASGARPSRSGARRTLDPSTRWVRTPAWASSSTSWRMSARAPRAASTRSTVRSTASPRRAASRSASSSLERGSIGRGPARSTRLSTAATLPRLGELQRELAGRLAALVGRGVVPDERPAGLQRLAVLEDVLGLLGQLDLDLLGLALLDAELRLADLDPLLAGAQLLRRHEAQRADAALDSLARALRADPRGAVPDSHDLGGHRAALQQRRRREHAVDAERGAALTAGEQPVVVRAAGSEAGGRAAHEQQE